MNKRLCITGVWIVLGVGIGLAQPMGPRGDEPGHRPPPIAPFNPSGMPGGGPMNSSPMMLDVAELQKMLSEIGINKTTTDKVVTISRNFISMLEERLIKIQREELNIKEELLKDKPDMQAIQAAIARKAHIFSEIEFNQIKRDLDIKVLLTREEYEQWKSAMIQKMRKMMPPPREKTERVPGGPEGPKADAPK